MKLFIRTMIFSFAILINGSHIRAMEPIYIKKTSDVFAEKIARWHKNENYHELEKFCLNNPIFKWIENNLEIKSWDDQNIGNFWKKIKEDIWKNNQHRINSFIELICFLKERIEKEFNLESPKENRKKLYEELETIKKDPEHYTQDHYDLYKTHIKQLNELINRSIEDEFTYLKVDDFSYWKTMIKRALKMNINFQSKEEEYILAKISMHAQQILDSIFMYDPTFTK